MNTLVVCLVFLLVAERSVGEFTAFENGMLSSSIEKRFLPLRNTVPPRVFSCYQVWMGSGISITFSTIS